MRAVSSTSARREEGAASSRRAVRKGLGERSRRTGDETIYRELSGAIIDHRLPPGTPLPEEALASAFGVSRTVTRKALHRLLHEKLVEVRPNRGAVVAQPTTEEARQVFEARRVIEEALVAGAIEAVDENMLRALRCLVEEESAAAARGDRRVRIRLSGEFHRRLATASGNDVLGDFLRELVSRTSLIIALYEAPGATPCSHEDHGAILDRIEAGDKTSALRCMNEHLRRIEGQLQLSDADRAVDLQQIFGHVRERLRSKREDGR